MSQIINSVSLDQLAPSFVLTAPSNKILPSSHNPTFPYRKIDQQGSISYNVDDGNMYYSDGTQWNVIGGNSCTSLSLNADSGTATTVSCIGNVKTGINSQNVFSTAGSGSTISLGLKNGSLNNDTLLWNSGSGRWVIGQSQSSSQQIINITSSPATIVQGSINVSSISAGIFNLPDLVSGTGQINISFLNSINATGANGTVNSIVSDGTYLYVGGAFTSINSKFISYLARYVISTGQIDTTWLPNPNNTIYALALDNSNGLYIGGSFTTVGGVSRSNMAKVSTVDGSLTGYNPATFNGAVKCILLNSTYTNVYIGGQFTGANPLTYGYFSGLNTTTGSITGRYAITNVVRPIIAITAPIFLTDDATGTYIIGTNFSYNFGTLQTQAVKVDSGGNVIWTTAITPGLRLTALTDTYLYYLSSNSPSAIRRLNKTTGVLDATTLPLTGISFGTKTSMILNGQFIYCAISGNNISGTGLNNLFRFDKDTFVIDTTWAPQPNSLVQSISVTSTRVYACGGFTNIGGGSANHIGSVDKITGAYDAAYPITANVNAFSTLLYADELNGFLYVTGSSTICGVSINGLGRIFLSSPTADSTWIPSTTIPVGSETTGVSLAFDSTYVYASIGSSSITIGGTTQNYFCKLTKASPIAFDGTFTLPSILSVQSISGNAMSYPNFIYFSNLYPNTIAGNTILQYQDNASNYLLKTNTSSTGVVDISFASPIITGSSVNSLQLDEANSNLYISGVFSSLTSLSGVVSSRNNIASLNSSTASINSWNPNANNSINSILLDGNGNLYTGGAFTSIGGQTRNYIARLSTTTGNADSWNPNANNTVNALSIQGSNIYVAGTYTTIGSAGRLGFSRISTTTGVADYYNPNVSPGVVTILNVGGTIYVGGDFTTISGFTQNRIAKLLTNLTVNSVAGEIMNPVGQYSINLYQDSVVYNWIGYNSGNWLVQIYPTN